MRLWHKDLLSVLPKQQLVSQWRECRAISGMMAKNNGTPNMILVNSICVYDLAHFAAYKELVRKEMKRRGYCCSCSVNDAFEYNLEECGGYDRVFCEYLINNPLEIFPYWHNDRYLTQCFYNLQEKYDCGGITDQEWCKVVNKYYERSCQNHGH